MFLTVLWFIVGLILLIKGGDWFVDGATGIAKRFRIPDILIGATVVSIGTTLPEVMVSATDAFAGHGQIVYGNAIGSIICNTALVAATTIAIRPSRIERKSFILPVCVFFSAAALYSFVAYFFGEFSRIVGIIILAIFLSYIGASVYTALKSAKHDETTLDEPHEKKGLALEIVMLVIGAAIIAFGADLLVDNGIIIAEALGVPESVIGLTFIAIGTSLPELVTAITSIAKGHGALSLGNVIGANILNLVLVSGVASVISPFPIPNGKQLFGINSSLVIDIPVMLSVMAILTVPTLISRKLTRTQGILLLCIYVAFFAVQFII